MIKRIGIFMLALTLLIMTGCAKKPEEISDTSDTLNVYATFYPLYALTDMLVEGVDSVRLNCLVQPQDGCLRDYMLSNWDLALLSEAADVVIAGGCGLESFESLLYVLGESGPAISAMLYDMDLLEQNAVNASEDTDSHWLDANPYIYMNTGSAMELAERIAASLCMLDAGNEAAYNRNLENAQNRLKSLQEELKPALSTVSGKPVIVMNEAFVYVAEEYALDIDLCYARESGESLEAYDLESCLQLLSGSSARVILIEKQAPQALCRALEEAGYILAYMDTMSSRRADEGADGYFAAQRANAAALVDAFSQAESAA